MFLVQTHSLNNFHVTRMKPIIAPEVKMMNSRDIGDMLSLQIVKDDTTGAIHIKSIEIAQPNFHHRMTFKDDSTIEDVITAEFSEYLVGLLKQLDGHKKIVSVPDAIFSLPGIAMGRLRLMARSKGANPRRIIVTFKYLIGSLQRVIRPNMDYQFPTISVQDTLNLSNLKDLVLPIAEGVDGAKEGFAEGEAPFRGQAEQKLEHVEQDLLFYIELLKRYVQGISESDFLEDRKVKRISKD